MAGEEHNGRGSRIPFNARVSGEFKHIELPFLAKQWRCSLRSAMEQAVHRAYIQEGIEQQQVREREEQLV